LKSSLGLVSRGFEAMRGLERPFGGEESEFCGYLADALHNLPELLLRYGDMDRVLFRRSAEACRAQVAPRLRDRWDPVFRTVE
jgi:hypothetical protein